MFQKITITINLGPELQETYDAEMKAGREMQHIDALSERIEGVLGEHINEQAEELRRAGFVVEVDD